MTHLVPAIRPVLGTRFRRDSLYRRAGALPSFHIAPARTRTAVDLISGNVLGTYNSAAPAMAVGPDGLLFQPAPNAPVIEYDPVTLTPHGVRIWNAVTNLLVNSATLSTQTVSLTAQAYTLHFTGTGTVTLSGASTAGPLVGTGIGEKNRVRLTFTPTAGALTLTVNGTVSNAQLNTGTTAGPYVPTTTTAASSTADVWSITGADFSRIVNVTAGTIYIRYGPTPTQSPVTNNSLFAISASATSDSNIIRAFVHANASPVFNVRSNAVDQAYLTSIAHDNSVDHSFAAAYALNDFAKATDTGDFRTDTLGDLPAVTPALLQIGSTNFGGLTRLSSYISELAIWRSRVPNANHQALAAS